MYIYFSPIFPFLQLLKFTFLLSYLSFGLLYKNLSIFRCLSMVSLLKTLVVNVKRLTGFKIKKKIKRLTGFKQGLSLQFEKSENIFIGKGGISYLSTKIKGQYCKCVLNIYSVPLLKWTDTSADITIQCLQPTMKNSHLFFKFWFKIIFPLLHLICPSIVLHSSLRNCAAIT